MTVNELIAELNKIKDKDQPICVYTHGGLSPYVAVETKSISHGFDWTRGKILIHTAVPLVRKKTKGMTPEEQNEALSAWDTCAKCGELTSHCKCTPAITDEEINQQRDPSMGDGAIR